MRLRLTGLLLAATFVFTGCATAPPTAQPLRSEALATQGTRIGVALSTLPKPDTQFPGASCLLCYATASAVNSSLTTQVRTFTTQDLVAVRDDLAKLLRERGMEPVLIAQEIDLERLPEGSKDAGRARRDFTALRSAHKIDKLLVVQVDGLGVTRNYSAYVPTGDPRATLNGAGYIVDLATQKLDWYLPLAVSVPAADNKWDEPPKYPGVTNAYFQALEMAMDQLKQPLRK